VRPLNALTGPATEVDPGLGVTGPTCPRGHVNPTEARYCRRCGLTIAGAAATGSRPVVGALVRADGVRVLLRDEIALSACSPVPSANAPAMVTARIVFLGWDPYALAETPGVQWCGRSGAPVPLDPGDAAPLSPGAHLAIGLDAYTYEPLGPPAPVSSVRPTSRRAGRGRRRRRGRRLPDRSLFRPAD
jgi:hypothetical protein